MDSKDNRVLITGNEAIGYGAIYADCMFYVGYPITPQNEVIEFFAREFPERGRVFVQADSEITSINVLCGAAAYGARAMTSTSSTAFSLMQEGISAIAAADIPCVIVDVQRGGPGAGTTQTAQMDYNVATRGGHGDYHTIVLAPSSVAENFEMVQLAFHLADKYRHPVIMLSDGITGQMKETVELQTIAYDYPPLERDWAVRGSAMDGLKRKLLFNTTALVSYYDYLFKADKKYREIMASEVRYEADGVEDADLILVAYGSSARIAMGAMKMAQKQGYKVGIIRPITLWPFPSQVISETASRAGKFLVVEDSLGQMVDDVKASVEGKADVHLVGVLDRHLPGPSGIILPITVLKKIKEIMK